MWCGKLLGGGGGAQSTLRKGIVFYAKMYRFFKGQSLWNKK